jgi:2'-5' RNA ligase
MLRSIAIYPRIDGDAAIHRVRSRFDRLATKVPYHVTLVFPFSSDLPGDEIAAHMAAAAVGIGPVSMSLGAPAADDDVIHLPVLGGQEAIRILHGRLHSGLLAPFLRTDVVYAPHVTVGRCRDRDDRQACLREAEAIRGLTGVAEVISSEIIEADESSTREIDVPLR